MLIGIGGLWLFIFVLISLSGGYGRQGRMKPAPSSKTAAIIATGITAVMLVIALVSNALE
jgi:hypothetical protein